MRNISKPAVRRIWVIDQELRKNSYPSTQSLAQRNEVDVKTIYRDFDTLRDDYQAPVEFCQKRKGWYYTVPTYRLPALLITEGEVLALFLAQQVLHSVQGTMYQAEVQQAITKLAEFLPDKVSMRWSAVDQLQTFHRSTSVPLTPEGIEVFRSLTNAVMQQQQVELRYWGAARDEESARVVDPWHLACVDGDWYLIAWCHLRQSVRTFVPSRIRGIQLCEATFDRPGNFKIDEFLKQGAFRIVTDPDTPLQIVQLRFAPSAAKYIRERGFHAAIGEKIEHHDGTLDLQLALSSFVEVRRFILSWGSECEVLSPLSLRADIQREATAMLMQAVETATAEHKTTVPPLLPSRTQRAEPQRPRKTARNQHSA